MLEKLSKNLINEVIEQSKQSPRLRKNYNLHKDLNDKCQRLINALQLNTVVPIHRHEVDEVFILLQGKVKALIYDDKGNILDSVILDREEMFGVQIPANTWHNVEVLEPDSVLFEVKEGPYIPHEISGILEIKKLIEYE